MRQRLQEVVTKKYTLMNLARIIVGISLVFVIPTSCAAAPCDFKGVSIGDKLTRKQLMAKLGIKHFKLDPDYTLWRPAENDERQYGYIGARDIAMWRAGPICIADVCYVPFGVEMKAKVPASVEIVFAGDTITDIRVGFSSQYWEQIVPTLIQKYGLNRYVEKNPNYVIIDDLTNKSVTVNRTIIASKAGGLNEKTKDRCEMMASNYDSKNIHYYPLGAYRAFFNIDMIQGAGIKFEAQHP